MVNLLTEVETESTFACAEYGLETVYYDTSESCVYLSFEENVTLDVEDSKDIKVKVYKEGSTKLGTEFTITNSNGSTSLLEGHTLKIDCSSAIGDKPAKVEFTFENDASITIGDTTYDKDTNSGTLTIDLNEKGVVDKTTLESESVEISDITVNPEDPTQITFRTSEYCLKGSSTTDLTKAFTLTGLEKVGASNDTDIKIESVTIDGKDVTLQLD